MPVKKVKSTKPGSLPEGKKRKRNILKKKFNENFVIIQATLLPAGPGSNKKKQYKV